MSLQVAASAVLALFGWAACADTGDGIRINKAQVIGTHTSSPTAPHPTVMRLIERGGRGRAEGLDYPHRPLADQFSRLGIRQIELDVFADPEGGRYAEPA